MRRSLAVSSCISGSLCITQVDNMMPLVIIKSSSYALGDTQRRTGMLEWTVLETRHLLPSKLQVIRPRNRALRHPRKTSRYPGTGPCMPGTILLAQHVPKVTAAIILLHIYVRYFVTRPSRRRWCSRSLALWMSIHKSTNPAQEGWVGIRFGPRC